MSSVTPLEHTAIGGVAGFTETCIMQPTIAIKNALQEGRPIPRSPMTLYRGLAVSGRYSKAMGFLISGMCPLEKGGVRPSSSVH